MHVNRCHRKKRRKRNVIFVNTSVGKDKYVGTLVVSFIYFNKSVIDDSFDRCALIEDDRYFCDLESGLVHLLDLKKVKV